jgi:hypothetical protein
MGRHARELKRDGVTEIRHFLAVDIAADLRRAVDESCAIMATRQVDGQVLRDTMQRWHGASLANFPRFLAINHVGLAQTHARLMEEACDQTRALLGRAWTLLPGR